MADRNKVVYKFKAPRNRNGRAKYRLEFVPTRDLTARDVDRLSPEELEAVKTAVMPNGNKLYASVGGRKKKAEGEPVDETEDEVEDESEDGADESSESGDEPVDESGEPEVGAE